MDILYKQKEQIKALKITIDSYKTQNFPDIYLRNCSMFDIKEISCENCIWKQETDDDCTKDCNDYIKYYNLSLKKVIKKLNKWVKKYSKW